MENSIELVTHQSWLQVDHPAPRLINDHKEFLDKIKHLCNFPSTKQKIKTLLSSQLNCQWWFQLKFKDDLKEHFSQPTAQSSKLEIYSKVI